MMKSSTFWKHLCDCCMKSIVTLENRGQRKELAREEQNGEGDGMKRQSGLLSKFSKGQPGQSSEKPTVEHEEKSGLKKGLWVLGWSDLEDIGELCLVRETRVQS